MKRGFGPWASFLLRHLWRTSGVLLGVAVVLGLGGYQASRLLQFRHHLSAAHDAEEHYDFDRAREHLAVCLQLRPGDANVRLLAARTARRTADYRAAEEELNAHRALRGDDHPAQILERALLAAQQGDLPKVRDYLRSCLDAGHPQSTLILEALVRGCLGAFQLNEAIYWLEQLLQRDPHNVPGLVARALLYENGGKVEAALETYRTALEYQPEYRPARLRLAELLLHRNNLPEAVAHFERLYQRHPHQEEVVLGLARCRRMQNQLEEAEGLLDGLLAEQPEQGKALAERGWIALLKEQRPEAEKWLRQALARLPCDRQVNYHLALCLQQQGNESEAAHYFRRTKEIDTDLKRLIEVMHMVVRAPTDPAPRLEAGLICLRLGQDQQGLSWLLGTLQINPGHRPTHAALAAYFERRGQMDRAAYHRQMAGANASPSPGEVP